MQQLTREREEEIRSGMLSGDILDLLAEIDRLRAELMLIRSMPKIQLNKTGPVA